ncbi:hypothetical protein UZ36_01615, partial [Candidatus Nitromaritima sp. SCGC AAA799-C22]
DAIIMSVGDGLMVVESNGIVPFLVSVGSNLVEQGTTIPSGHEKRSQGVSRKPASGKIKFQLQSCHVNNRSI